MTSRYRCDALTNWAMKPLTLGAGHLWVPMFPWGMNQRWNVWNVSYINCGYEIKWSYDPRSYERNFCNCVKKPEKFRFSTGFEPVTSRYRCDALTRLFRLLYAIAKIAFITARIIASLDFISAVHIWYISHIISSLIHSSREHWNPQMTSSQRQWLHSSVG